MTTELVKSVSIDDLLNKRNAIIERMEKMLVLFNEVNEISTHYFGDKGPDLSLRGVADYLVNGRVGHYRSIPLFSQSSHTQDGLSAAKQRLDKAGWKFLLSESGMRTLMNHTMRAQWDKLLYEDSETVPELTRGTIQATFSKLNDDKEYIFEQGVIEVFKALSWHYKSNLPHKFGKRIVIGNVRGYYQGGAADKLDDLCRVFSIMDGATVADHRFSSGSELVRMARAKLSGTHQFEYFFARWFKNANVHVYFSRPDLVDKLNLIIGKHYPNALPAEVR